MFQFISQMARAVARIFAPATSDLVPVGFQPITDDTYKYEGSACYVSNLEALDSSQHNLSK